MDLDRRVLAAQEALAAVLVERDEADASNKEGQEIQRGSRCQKSTGIKASFEIVSTWPLVTCDQCNDTEDAWRRMESTGPHLDFTSNTSSYHYRCWKCVLAEEATVNTEAEAVMFIEENRRGSLKRKERIRLFKDSFKKVDESIPLVTSRREKIKLTRDDMETLFASFGKFFT
jgi:hypothetical protein